jgi:hypothetical protein
MNIDCIASPRPASESTHLSASYMYTLFLCIINTPKPNCEFIFEGVVPSP